MTIPDPVLERAAEYGAAFRSRRRPIHPTADVAALRRGFCQPLNDTGRDGSEVIEDLIAAAEPGLVGNTDGNFFAWVMGGSNPVGVAADWLTSIWGQNAAIFQTAPAAAIAEEAVSDWMLDLLDLPCSSSVGLVTGATMASFVSLAAARGEVLTRVGYDLDRDGLQGAPLVRIFLSDDAHVSNHAALRYLGFGEANLVRVASDAQGVMRIGALEAALEGHSGPKIIIGQAGHINSGAFDDFTALADLRDRHDAWLHVDGAFGLWLRVLPERKNVTTGLDRADSWAVDGHKWLQIPYDSGFAIVRDADAHRRAMAIAASYLTESPEDGRNPTSYNPELSRRARGFAAWSVLRCLGRNGVIDLIRRHCSLARDLARRIDQIEGLTVLNEVVCNQTIVATEADTSGPEDDARIQRLADELNATGRVFLRTDAWRGRMCLRFSVSAGPTDARAIEALASQIRESWTTLASQPAK